MISRFDDVENKQKYNEVLLKNQKWEYSAPVSNNRRVKPFLDDIKENTCDMRYGESNGRVWVDGHRLAHDGTFLPHWREFANALEEYQYALKCLPEETASKFYIWDIGLPKRVLDLLSNALESTHFKKFGLRRNQFGRDSRDGIKFALNYIQNNPKLESFDFGGNTINHEDDLNRLCEIIKGHPAINAIELESCDNLVDGHRMLCSIMTAGKNKLKSIDLSYNMIKTGGSTFIADFLTTNPILENLMLDGNGLFDNDAISIARALKKNTNLRYLNILGNNLADAGWDDDDGSTIVTEPGWDALRKAEFDSTSLNSATDSNHTCFIRIPSHNEINGEDDNEGPFDRKALRQKKIYSILSARNRKCSNSNVLYFSDVPVEFLPDMLISIQQYSGYYTGYNAPPKHHKHAESLSVVYEVMRRWDKVISVYESLGNN